MTELVERVEQNLLLRRLLRRGGAVLVAVSGGLDSMLLLKVLHALSSRYRWKLIVAHFNHQLRGHSSNADERLVRKTAAAMKLPFIVERADVRSFAENSKLSIEMAARKLRHEFFARAAKERKISVVALAHHADDQVELFFLRALRGAGGEGLAGMKWHSPSPVNKKIMLIRPLLNVTKTELREFAKEHKVHFREDATNAQIDLPRNRVRHELLPLLRRNYQPALTKTILRLMDIVGAEAEVVTQRAQKWINNLSKGAPRPGPLPARRGGRSSGEGNRFENLSVAVQRRVLQLQLAEHGFSGDFELIERLRNSPDVFVSISRNFSVARDNAGRLNLRSASLAGFQDDQLAANLAADGGRMDFAGIELRWSFDVKKTIRLGRQIGCEYFDANKVGRTIVLRHWRAGDRFQPIGMKTAVKLQDFFTNQKIPRERRHTLIVAEAANGEIFWVQNLRISERFKVAEGTRHCLVWRWRTISR